MKHSLIRTHAIVTSLAVLGCERLAGHVSADRVYTLYRDSQSSPKLRVHIATLDADDTELFNRNTCEELRALEETSMIPGTPPHRYWCEKGYYRP